MSVTACVGYTWSNKQKKIWKKEKKRKMMNGLVYDCIRFLFFIFKILYWIMYISNNAIILPVCNIMCRNMPVHKLLLSLPPPFPASSSFLSPLFPHFDLTWCSYIKKYLSNLQLRCSREFFVTEVDRRWRGVRGHEKKRKWGEGDYNQTSKQTNKK